MQFLGFRSLPLNVIRMFTYILQYAIVNTTKPVITYISYMLFQRTEEPKT